MAQVRMWEIINAFIKIPLLLLLLFMNAPLFIILFKIQVPPGDISDEAIALFLIFYALELVIVVRLIAKKISENWERIRAALKSMFLGSVILLNLPFILISLLMLYHLVINMKILSPYGPPMAMLLIGYGMLLHYQIREFNLINELKLLWSSRERKKKTAMQIFQELAPHEFEDLICRLLKKMGYEAHVTRKTGYGSDFGIDIIAKKDGKTIAVQAKKWIPGHLVGAKEVQMALGSMWKHRAEKVIMVTTSDFTEQAVEQTEGAPVELWNGRYLEHLLQKYPV